MNNHFQGINATERYNNDLLNEIRKQTALLERQIALLEQLALLLKKEEKSEKPVVRTRKRAKKSV